MQLSLSFALPLDRPKKDVFFALALGASYNAPGTVADLQILHSSGEDVRKINRKRSTNVASIHRDKTKSSKKSRASKLKFTRRFVYDVLERKISL